jgi:hypothetical protein
MNKGVWDWVGRQQAHKSEECFGVQKKKKKN